MLHDIAKLPHPSAEVPGHSQLNLNIIQEPMNLNINPLNCIFCGLLPPQVDQDCGHDSDQWMLKLQQTSLIAGSTGGDAILLLPFLFHFFSILSFPHLFSYFMILYSSVSTDNNQNGYIPLFHCNQIVLKGTCHIHIYNCQSFTVISP